MIVDAGGFSREYRAGERVLAVSIIHKNALQTCYG